MTGEQLAWEIRRHAVEMTHISGGSHIGAVLSIADVIGVLFAEVMHIDPDDPKWEGRDRFILSKGHASAAVYAALAEKGFIPIEELRTHYQDGGRLHGHISHYVPGVDFSTGSLGHGLSAAAGMAYAAKKERKTHKVYAVLGDGECDEGSVWEAVIFANHYRLNNLIAIIDHNHMQSLDFTDNTLELDSLAAKWSAFGWDVTEIDGNSCDEIRKALTSALQDTGNKPTAIIAHTVKGCGISFMQNDVLWHYRFPHDGWEYDLAVTELHAHKPDGAEDIYTPAGIRNPILPAEDDDIYHDHTTSSTWNTTYPEPMRRVEAKPGSMDRPIKLQRDQNEEHIC